MKIALLFFTLLSAIKPHFKNSPVIVYPFKCPLMIHRVLLVSIQWKLIRWVIDIDFITVFVILNHKRYIFCYCILSYNNNCAFDIYVSYMSFIIIFLTNFESVISCHFCHNFSDQTKNYINFNFQFQYTPTLENTLFALHISSEHRTAEQYQGSANCGGLDINTVVNLPSSVKLIQSSTLFSQCEKLA